jgi:hypothetical protein
MNDARRLADPIFLQQLLVDNKLAASEVARSLAGQLDAGTLSVKEIDERIGEASLHLSVGRS